MPRKITLVSADGDSRIVLYSVFGRLLLLVVKSPRRTRRILGFRTEEALLEKINVCLKDAAERESRVLLPKAKEWPWPAPTESDLPYRWLED